MNGILSRVQKTSEASVATQQELFHRWISGWPWVSVAALPFGQLHTAQKRGIELIGELLQRENTILSVQLKMGLETMDRLLQLAQAKDPQELRTRTIEWWQKSLDEMCLISRVQMRTLQYAVDSLMNRPHSPAEQPCRMPGADRTRPEEETGEIPVKAQSDQEELKEALHEYEMSKGDWSRDR